MITSLYKGNVVDYVLQGKCQCIMHVCNNMGVMGSGVAREIRDRIPEAYKAYRDYYDYWSDVEGKIPLGKISFCDEVINLHAQDGYGKSKRHLDYEGLYKSLACAREIMIGKVDHIAVPFRMGSDRAGGDWNVVTAMLNSVFAFDTGINITVCTL